MQRPDLERGAGLALWRQIERQLAAEIERGVHPPGTRLPTESELAERFAVNRHTVRRAVGELAGRGVLRVEQGRGTFVQENVLPFTVGRRTRFTENVARARREPGGELLRGFETPAPEAAATALGLVPDHPVVVIERLGVADGQPISLGLHHFPRDRFPGMIAAYAEARTISGALALLGVADYERKTTRVTARLPSAHEARLLRQSASRPILETEAVNVDSEGRPIEYGVACFPGERVQLVFEP